MPGSFKDIFMHDDAGIKADDIAAFFHVGIPPDIFDAFFQTGAEWPVIPDTGEAAVDLRTAEDKTPAAAHRDYFL